MRWRAPAWRLAGGGAAALALALVVLMGGGDEEGSSPDPRGAASEVEARVVRVVDGDTIVVDLDGAEERVRYIGVDTPESVQPGQPVECFGREASSFNRRLVEGRTVRLELDRERRDHYGRLLAYVHVGRRLVNAELVRRGLARTLEIEPNTSRAPRLARLAARAGREGRGLWAEC